MNKEREIKEMTSEMTTAFLTAAVEGHEEDEINYAAEIMVERGYGNVKQAVKEFSENIIKPVIREIVTLMFNDYEPHCKVDNCEEIGGIPCLSPICIEKNIQIWQMKIDEKIEEPYGDVKVKRGYGNTERAKEEMAQQIFKDMLEVISESADCVITVNADDVKQIARRYGVKL